MAVADKLQFFAKLLSDGSDLIVLQGRGSSIAANERDASEDTENLG